MKTSGGKLAQAHVEIDVAARMTVFENGNARWPDDRACEFKDVGRVLTRTLRITMPDGVLIPVQNAEIKLPAASGRSWSALTPCNAVVGEIDGFLSAATGNAEQWQSYIDGQRAEVKKIVDQFGQVVP